MNDCKYPGIFSAAVSHGFRVFPVLPGNKRPAVSWSQFRDREPTAEEIAAWDDSDFNAGVICGVPSGIVVVDADSPETEAYLQSLDLPPTPTVKTAKGSHRYFKCPNAILTNRVRIAGHDLDLRVDGGYVVGAGSTHQSGAKYEWVISPEEVPFAEFPAAILELCDAGSSPAVSMTPVELDVPVEHGINRFVMLELREACNEIAGASEGSRNNTLFVIAVRIAKHVAAAGSEWVTFAEALGDAGLAAGLAEAEIRSTLDSAWAAGSKEPTEWISIANHYVYLAAQERYYHKLSGGHLKPSGFNGAYGRPHKAKDTFSGFLLNGGFVSKVQDITYEPTAPPGPIERDGLKYYNTFRPSDVVAVFGDPAPFLKFMEYLVPTDFERDHLLKVIAFTVRNPGVKVRHAILLGSAVQGIGKSLLAEAWGRLLGTHNVRKTSSGEISSAFQGWIKENLLVVCEELNIGQGLAVYNDLKDLITSDHRPINEKHLAVRVWPIYSTFLMLTNLKVPLLIEETDRRLFVIGSPAQKARPGYYKELVEWLNENIGVVRWYLDQIDLTEFDAHGPPPMTDAKRALINRSRHPIVQEVEYFIDQRTGLLDRDVVTLDCVALAFDQRNRPTPHRLGRALREFGAVNLDQHWVDGRRVSLWAIRNFRYWERCSSADRVEEHKRSIGVFADWPASISIRHICEYPARLNEVT